MKRLPETGNNENLQRHIKYLEVVLEDFQMCLRRGLNIFLLKKRRDQLRS